MSGPHQDGPLVAAGTPPDDAAAALVAVHGRGATARSILGLAGEVSRNGVALLAPQAAGNSWYSGSFVAPVASNEPGLSSGLRALDDAVDAAGEAGIPVERTALLGFSQGACLASEYAARNARRYGGLAVLSGGLVGPEGTEFDHGGSLDGTPVFVGCGDVDHHVPVERVHETAAVFEALDGDVTERIYGGMGHAVNDDELDRVAGMVAELVPDGG